jgi:hypothetical protein
MGPQAECRRGGQQGLGILFADVRTIGTGAAEPIPPIQTRETADDELQPGLEDERFAGELALGQRQDIREEVDAALRLIDVPGQASAMPALKVVEMPTAGSQDQLAGEDLPIHDRDSIGGGAVGGWPRHLS